MRGGQYNIGFHGYISAAYDDHPLACICLSYGVEFVVNPLIMIPTPQVMPPMSLVVPPTAVMAPR